MYICMWVVDKLDKLSNIRHSIFIKFQFNWSFSKQFNPTQVSTDKYFNFAWGSRALLIYLFLLLWMYIYMYVKPIN